MSLGAGGKREKGVKIRVIHTPLVTSLILISAVSGLLSVGAFIYSLKAVNGQLQRLQESREQAASDSCHLLRALVTTAALEAHKPRSGELFLQATGLSDCHRYALTLLRVRH